MQSLMASGAAASCMAWRGSSLAEFRFDATPPVAAAQARLKPAGGVFSSYDGCWRLLLTEGLLAGAPGSGVELVAPVNAPVLCHGTTASTKQAQSTTQLPVRMHDHAKEARVPLLWFGQTDRLPSSTYTAHRSPHSPLFQSHPPARPIPPSPLSAGFDAFALSLALALDSRCLARSLPVVTSVLGSNGDIQGHTHIQIFSLLLVARRPRLASPLVSRLHAPRVLAILGISSSH